MSLNARQVATASVLAALYAVGVIVLAPISFELFQVRVADMLLPLSILFGLPAVLGLTIGTIVANAVSPFGIIDIVGGTIANFLATFSAWQMARRYNFRGCHFLATVVENAMVTLIVGTYLQVFFLHLPDVTLFGLALPGILISWSGVFLGSLIAINIGGYILLKLLIRRIPPSWKW